MEWMFWKRSRCPLCDHSFKGGSEIWLKHAEGMSKLNICDECSTHLESKKGLHGMLQDEQMLHEPEEI